ncbi:MAG: response regulator [Hyphomicrobiaceae bacterium]|nr:response regulator [Hyphomicrobiaceae bacterium]
MKKSTGGNFLARKADLTKSRMGGPTLSDILIVEDENFDADRLRATLHIMFGYDIQVRRARTLGSALDAVIERAPEVVFLDDYLKPNDNATQTIPFLRKCGYQGPIVVVSGAVDRQRRTTLLKAGAADVIHKDELDSVRVSEALARVHEAGGAARESDV